MDRWQGSERVQLRVIDVAVPDPGPADNSLGGTNDQLSSLAQPRQHLQSGIAVGGQSPSRGLKILHRLHGVVADAAVGAAGIEAGLGQSGLDLLHFGERQRALASRGTAG